MSKKRIVILLCFLIIIVASGLKLDKYSQQIFDKRYANLASSSALLDIIGELRYTAAALLWVKIDIYHHEYEFKGKDIMRNTSIMPLFRLVTLLDPHFIQAYDVGAYTLVVDLKKVEEGMEFLKEGMNNNPDSFELTWQYAFLLYYQKKYEEAVPVLLRAREIRDNTTTEVYDEHMKISWVDTRIIDCYKRLGQNEKIKPFEDEIKAYHEKYKDWFAERDKKKKSTNSEHSHDRSDNDRDN